MDVLRAEGLLAPGLGLEHLATDAATTGDRTSPPLPSPSTLTMSPSIALTASSVANVVGVPKGAYRKIIQQVADPLLI